MGVLRITFFQCCQSVPPCQPFCYCLPIFLFLAESGRNTQQICSLYGEDSNETSCALWTDPPKRGHWNNTAILDGPPRLLVFRLSSGTFSGPRGI